MRIAMTIALALLATPTMANPDCAKERPRDVARMAMLSVAASECWFLRISRSKAESRLRTLLSNEMCVKSGSQPLDDAMVGILVHGYLEVAKKEFRDWGEDRCSKARSINVN